MNEIQVTVKNVYGRDTVYPACDKALLFTKLVGQKTLTVRELELIKALGYTIKVTIDCQYL